MNNNGENSTFAATFLLAEYKRHNEHFLYSEELGERRVNFFLTLVTAVVGALAIREEGILVDEKVDDLFFAALGALLIFGWVTLVRLIRRNLASTRELRAMGRLRRYFIDNDQSIETYLFYGAYDDSPVREYKWKALFSFGTGGLVQTVSVVNSLLFAGLLGLAGLSRSPQTGWQNAIAGFAGTWIAQFLFVHIRYKLKEPEDKHIRFRTPPELEK